VHFIIILVLYFLRVSYVKKNFYADVSVSGHFKEFAVLISFSPDVIIRPIICGTVTYYIK